MAHDGSGVGSSNEILKKISPPECKESKSPIFGGESIVELDIMTDLGKYFAFNKSRKERKQKVDLIDAVVSIADENNKRDFIPLALSTRGNSRHLFCEYRPIRLTFLNQDIEKIIEDSIKPLRGENSNPEEEALYFQRYYKKLNELAKSEELIGISQDDNMFDKIGDDVKIVTHCGKSNWSPFFGKIEKNPNDKIHGEHLIYQILDKLETATMKTRLIKITYRYVNGQPMTTQWGFFRENPGSIVKRCGLTKKKNKSTDKAIESISKFNAKFLHRFVFSKDFELRRDHNVKRLYQETRDITKTVYVPYDFDLSGILEPGFIKNFGLSLKQSAWIFKLSILDFSQKSNLNKAAAIIQIEKVLDVNQPIKEEIKKSRISGELKNRFLEWHQIYYKTLNDVLSKIK